MRGYEADVRKGAILMSVEARDQQSDANAIAENWVESADATSTQLMALPEGFEPSYQP